MGRIRYTSDLHFNHPFVAKLRGFVKPMTANGEVKGDADAHDETIIGNFNLGVKPDDLTFILGDFAVDWEGVEEKLVRLKGRKVLINGNHDITSSIHQDGWKRQAEWIGDGRFEAIIDFKRRKANHKEFLLSHYPYVGDHTSVDRCMQYRLRDEGLWLLHGHVHTKWGKTTDRHPRMIHVGLDAWDLHPVREEEVLDLMIRLDKEAEG